MEIGQLKTQVEDVLENTIWPGRHMYVCVFMYVYISMCAHVNIYIRVNVDARVYEYTLCHRVVFVLF